MEFVLTTYFDADPAVVEAELPEAVGPALEAAAGRIGSTPVDALTEQIPTGVRVTAGLGLLDGAELRVLGQHRLAAVEVRVPWTTDSRENRTLAATTFAAAIVAEVATAA